MKKTTPLLLISTLLFASGCGVIKPYNKPDVVVIEPNETAFVIPL